MLSSPPWSNGSMVETLSNIDVPQYEEQVPYTISVKVGRADEREALTNFALISPLTKELSRSCSIRRYTESSSQFNTVTESIHNYKQTVALPSKTPDDQSLENEIAAYLRVLEGGSLGSDGRGRISVRTLESCGRPVHEAAQGGDVHQMGRFEEGGLTMRERRIPEIDPPVVQFVPHSARTTPAPTSTWSTLFVRSAFCSMVKRKDPKKVETTYTCLWFGRLLCCIVS
jgi:hypothetical protein